MNRWILALVAALVAMPAGAELYKWVDADGNVHYSDTPPPGNAKKSERKKLSDKPAAATVPYATQQAMKNFPVTLYTYDCGDACKQAAALLAKRGIPHTVKDAMSADMRDELKGWTGGEEVAPVLVVGRNAQKGFQTEAWTKALDAAGYPSSAVGPVPAVPQPPKPAQPAAAAPADSQ